MIIKTENGWRQWQKGVINCDGHAVPSDNEGYPIAVYASKHPLVATPKYGSYMHLITAIELLQERRKFWENIVQKSNNGTTKRLSDGRLSVKLYDSSFTL